MDFRLAEKKFKKLKNQFETGTLTENEFKTQLEKLMVQDEQKDWWMIGTEMELWYRYDGRSWVQTTPPAKMPQIPSHGPKWLSIVWLALGGAFGGAIGSTVAFTMGGAIGGFVMISVLRLERVLVRWTSLLWILLACTIGGEGSWGIYRVSADAIGDLLGLSIGGAIGFAISGFLTAITLRGENAISNWGSVVVITLGWVFGGAIGWIIGGVFSEEYDIFIGWAIGGMVGWAIGGFFTVWQIREEKRNALPPATGNSTLA